MINSLVGKLVGKHSGPVLVVGGAPSVPAELRWLADEKFPLDTCLIISANEHAVHAGLKPHYACVNDDIHSALNVPQEPRMRRLMPDTKLLSRHWWADYRSPQLLACNSGLKALLYAAVLGANPIVAIGFGHYRDKQLYFHEAETRGKTNKNIGQEMGHFVKQEAGVAKALEHVPVRTVSGPLTRLWPIWNPDEHFPERALTQMERKALADLEDQRFVCMEDEAATFGTAMVPTGTIFAVTAGEMKSFGLMENVHDATDWDLANPANDRLKRMAASRAEHARMVDMIGKVRNSRRGIRRGIYDADLLRIIKWAEGGQDAGQIAKRISMPLDQVTWMLSTMGVLTAP